MSPRGDEVSGTRVPRYEVRSITGYSSGDREGTTYWVADTWYCYREVPLQAIVTGNVGRRDANGRRERGYAYTGAKTTTRRAMAERNCARLNAEHEAWRAAV